MEQFSQLPVLRILDANFNRGTEGLRVVEEYLRFVLNDAHLTNLCKQLRHDLRSALHSAVDLTQLASSRDTHGDVGTSIGTDEEYSRGSALDVATASLKRVEQALRCLEEYTKLCDSAAAQRFEQIRYRTYSLGKAILITADSVERLRSAQLYVLVDGRANVEEFLELVHSLQTAGVHVIQLRDKRLNDRDLLDRAKRLRDATRSTNTLFIMNDRPDLAALADADGVHVGQEELRVQEARAIVGTQKLIGVSTHSIEQARQAVLDGASYIGCGPTFPSPTKQFDSWTGLELLANVSAEISLPSFAIGGITLDNLPQVLSAGFTRVAVSSAIAGSKDPAKIVASFLVQLKEAQALPSSNSRTTSCSISSTMPES